MNTNDSDFNSLVADIKSAEKKAEEIKSNASTEAQNIIREAREEAAKINAQTEESVVKKKNRLLEAGVEKIESRVQSVLSGAKAEASKLKKKKLSKNIFDSLFRSVLQ